LIYLLTAIGLTPGGSSAVHMHTQTIHRTTQQTTLVGRLSGIRNQSGQTKINDELRKNYRLMGRVRAAPRLCELYPGICLTTEQKARKNLSQGSRRVPVGTMRTEYNVTLLRSRLTNAATGCRCQSCNKY